MKLPSLLSLGTVLSLFSGKGHTLKDARTCDRNILQACKTSTYADEWRDHFEGNVVYADIRSDLESWKKAIVLAKKKEDPFTVCSQLTKPGKKTTYCAPTGTGLANALHSKLGKGAYKKCSQCQEVFKNLQGPSTLPKATCNPFFCPENFNLCKEVEAAIHKASLKDKSQCGRLKLPTEPEVIKGIVLPSHLDLLGPVCTFKILPQIESLRLYNDHWRRLLEKLPDEDYEKLVSSGAVSTEEEKSLFRENLIPTESEMENVKEGETAKGYLDILLEKEDLGEAETVDGLTMTTNVFSSLLFMHEEALEDLKPYEDLCEKLETFKPDPTAAAPPSDPAAAHRAMTDKILAQGTAAGSPVRQILELLNAAVAVPKVKTQHHLKDIIDSADFFSSRFTTKNTGTALMDMAALKKRLKEVSSRLTEIGGAQYDLHVAQGHLASEKTSDMSGALNAAQRLKKSLSGLALALEGMSDDPAIQFDDLMTEIEGANLAFRVLKEKEDILKKGGFPIWTPEEGSSMFTKLMSKMVATGEFYTENGKEKPVIAPHYLADILRQLQRPVDLFDDLAEEMRVNTTKFVESRETDYAVETLSSGTAPPSQVKNALSSLEPKLHAFITDMEKEYRFFRVDSLPILETFWQILVSMLNHWPDRMLIMVGFDENRELSLASPNLIMRGSYTKDISALRDLIASALKQKGLE
uniref:Uncharacterized protein n=1 Tax=Chromera velia CCMP2878 TaxID=1169474 RepID=A0A0G4G2E7_9ALVE|eukprot:Cvel_19947.t1-p1 / transcript=Cvel_19947.t1 / gene=Cvel_19947 / organism=Chromera_velia_CCMP2878 / gene_product=hypothetical protein / transcript_product=hypothetical protein / location=Cvel_scaffold1755:17754-19835(+) / protein_length=694 / sequence_SO=supercontig / SO=protein_coding / is_pseudo=false